MSEMDISMRNNVTKREISGGDRRKYHTHEIRKWKPY